MEGYVLYGTLGVLALLALGGAVGWWLRRIGDSDRRTRPVTK